MTAYLTDRQVAEELGISWAQVQARCRARQWPHLRIGRKYAFTREHVQEIAKLCEQRPAEAPEDTWGFKTRGRAS